MFFCRCCSQTASFHCETFWHEPPVHGKLKIPRTQFAHNCTRQWSLTKWKPWNMTAPDITASRAAQPVLNLWSWPKLWYLPCHRWYSDRCSKKASSECCSLAAAEAEDYGWCWCCTGYWHAAALWGWSSSDGACRKETTSPRHKATVSHKVGSQPSEALKGAHIRDKKKHIVSLL